MRRDELTNALRREVSDVEVMEYHNRLVQASRVDAARQGVLLTAADFAPVLVSEFDVSDLSEVLVADDRSASQLEVWEAVHGLLAMVKRERPGNSRLVEVTSVWVHMTYGNERISAGAIATVLGITPAQAKDCLATMMSLIEKFRAEHV
ncbi:hypothetical protein [Lysinibacter cavernae]|uniref:hypothetical protein n=1 Tax=Lysinibacter cavernae TaxID=1640652 RepID=UPI0036D91B8C